MGRPLDTAVRAFAAGSDCASIHPGVYSQCNRSCVGCLFIDIPVHLHKEPRRPDYNALISEYDGEL